MAQPRVMDERLQSGTSPLMRKSICILAFSQIARDARVLRQIKYLLPLYDLIIIGYGAPPDFLTGSSHIIWKQLGNQSRPSIPNLMYVIRNHDCNNIRLRYRILRKINQLINRILSTLGIVIPRLYEAWYWRQPNNQEAWLHALDTRCDVYHANDWDMLPIASRAARKNHSRLVLDLHEYAPLEYEENPRWWKSKRLITYMLRKYSRQADASITVAQPIAERYRAEFGLNPTVIMNTPERLSIESEVRTNIPLKLIHHGGASRLRHPELMIETIARCNELYSLHFMFLPNAYVEELKHMADKIAPGRVFFHDSVPPDEITRELSQYDIGFYILPPTNYNNLVALPNKFLDFICAGLAVCIGPSPSMAEIVNKYALGVVGDSFKPEDIASLLNKTTSQQWLDMKQAARIAASELNAGTEMKKLIDIYARML